MKKNKKLIKNIKITVVVLMAVAIAFSALAPIFAEEITEETLKEEVNSFTEEVQEVVREFNETPRRITVTNRVQGIPASFAFRNELRERAAGEAVRYLQSVLNLDPETRVTSSGVGAPGRETSYFGPATRRALIRFQQKYDLAVTGILDAATRAKINEVMENGVITEEELTQVTNNLRARIITMLNTMRRLRERLRLLRDQEIEEEETEVEEEETEEETTE